jgi:hypothetical protein
LRQGAPEAQPAAVQQRHLPVWVVVALVLAFIALGVLVAR